jgi:hypothetical protein
VPFLNETGFAEIEYQDTLALKTDTVSRTVTDSAFLNANDNSIVTKEDTSQIRGRTEIQARSGLQQDTVTSGVSDLHAINYDAAGQDIPYYIPGKLYLFPLNSSLKNLNEQYFSIREASGLVYKDGSGSSGVSTTEEYAWQQYQNNTLPQDIYPDWLIAVIIGSLVILAWLKLFFNKFFDQVIVSMWNFQLGSKFLRDRGIFSRRVGLVLNLNFLLISGLYIYLALAHFKINPLSLKPFPAYAVYTGILTALLLVRYILTSLTGSIFNRQEYFREYLYHVLVIYKNLGIVLIPVVFCIAYIQENLRIYFIIFALGIIAAAYLFRFIKGFQIIIKKDVLIFYLILYLCTLEIIPVLFYYKFFSGWIN